MSADTYTPQAGSLPQRVCAYLGISPKGTTLTADDIADQFDVPYKNIHTQLARCVEHSLLLRAKDADGSYVYSLGKGAAASTATATTPTPASRPQPSRPTVDGLQTGAALGYIPPARQPRRVVDLMALEVTTAIPLPPSPTKARFDYAAVLNRLHTPGASYAVPANALGVESIKREIGRRHKHTQQRYTLRHEPDGSTRIWREA